MLWKFQGVFLHFLDFAHISVLCALQCRSFTQWENIAAFVCLTFEGITSSFERSSQSKRFISSFTRCSVAVTAGYSNNVTAGKRCSSRWSGGLVQRQQVILRRALTWRRRSSSHIWRELLVYVDLNTTPPACLLLEVFWAPKLGGDPRVDPEPAETSRLCCPAVPP